ncbi:ABC transporter permease [Dinghuibacter silviterrae]|uniref:ABC-type antimicrobial peptide transport system permease subunit n=1 Tax=Dinghuibacter silviterrae TaxID=1539049 RepID=A0A4R8DID4_9BACT|nr:ABC transporter permease [Dinghuibacter silviterrae]TDW97499.1 ABC-type antimicrobial peptide transport system permease subunit [Dinghuibacter silviterrae]
MLKNYLIAAYRNLVKHRVHSAINVLGLAVGMAVALLIGLWIKDELTYDKNFEHYDQLGVIWQNTIANGHVETWDDTPWPMGGELRANYAKDFSRVAMMAGPYGFLLGKGDKTMAANGAYAEAPMAEMLSLDMVSGSRKGLEGDPDGVLLSASLAREIFGDEQALGKVLRIDNQADLKVEGVYRDLPDNCSFSGMRFMANWDQLTRRQHFATQDNPWRSNSFSTYVELRPGVSPAQASQDIEYAKLKRVRQDEVLHHGLIFVHAMPRWRLHSDFREGKYAGGFIEYVWMFGLIGFGVLLLACINFMNLSTARSERRAKEVGVRKAIGSLRGQLIGQFMGESILVVVMAFVVALGLAQAALPFFNGVANKMLHIPWGSGAFWGAVALFCGVTGLIAGSYPALYLSSFRPVKVLKGTFKAGRWAALPRRALVVLQFTISVILIVGTVVVFRQIDFSKDRPVGYDRQGLFMVSMFTPDIHQHFPVVRDELLKTGLIAEAAESSSPTTGVWSTNSDFEWVGKTPGLSLDFPNIEVSPEYGKTVGWQFLDGRDFSRAEPGDTAAFVANETVVHFMGLQHPVGQIIRWDGHPFKLVGVIKDMLMESPYAAVRPTFYHLLPKDDYAKVMVRIAPGAGPHDALAKTEAIFKRFAPSQPFDVQFADTDFALKFGDEERIGRLAGFFTALAVFISCLGLFALASFTAEQRVKEIGIRKVLGASVVQLWEMLSREFVVLVGLSLGIALPVAFYLTRRWLQHYSYRSDLPWWIFAGAAVCALALTLATVSVQAVRAALANPVRSLRTE